jgi:hypothetical protein
MTFLSQRVLKSVFEQYFIFLIYVKAHLGPELYFLQSAHLYVISDDKYRFKTCIVISSNPSLTVWWVLYSDCMVGLIFRLYGGYWHII